MLTRRGFLILSAAALAVLSGCGSGPEAANPPRNGGRWRMPAEEDAHEATWMCWPSRMDVWGRDLPAVQGTILALARTIAEFEPVRILARPDEVPSLRARLGPADAEVVEGPVDDLWARDTLPCFLVALDPADPEPLAAGRVRFNGWGGKQVHDGDTRLAGLVAAHLGIPLVDPGLTGEGGGLEVDGAGTILAARSSWVNANRNPGRTEGEIAGLLSDLLGASRVLWVDGLAGEDITDGHIDTLARFAAPGVLVLDRPAFEEPDDVWYRTFVATRDRLSKAGRDEGGAFELNLLTQPETPRGTGEAFLSSYVNYYVCNGAVIAPRFGDRGADRAAAELLAELHPDREIVQLDIDAVAAGGGGIHCATQQQPATD